MSVSFRKNNIKVKAELEKRSIAFLEEAKASVSNAASDLSPVDTGALAQSFISDSLVVDSELTAYIGSSLEYAIWVEFGTGEYALNGDGRKGGWVYKDPKTGEFRFTEGSEPKRMLHKAFSRKKKAIKKRAEEIFRN